MVPTLIKAMPSEFGRYAEVFLGGGALFWALGVPEALLADSNPELINFYEAVRDAPEELLAAVSRLPVSKKDYYRVRDLRPDGLPPIRRAARFAYLNKTCFNGLYRVNRKGRFNTPFGGRTGVTILNAEDVLAASSLLRACTLRCSDFTDSLTRLSEGDFVYLDPPYLPIGGYSDFRRYTKDFFNEEHHIRLAIEFSRLRERGVKALLSNSDTPKIRCLYKEHHCVSVMASRQINCNAAGRGPIAELLVANYPLECDHALS